MARKKAEESKTASLTPQKLGKLREQQREFHVQQLRQQCTKYHVGMRVYKSILAPKKDNPLLLEQSSKRGKITDIRVCSHSGYPTILVLWDGWTVEVPEPPHLLNEDW